MERTRRSPTKVINYRKFHLSGDLDQQVSGKVERTIHQFEMATPTEMAQQLEMQKEATRKLQLEAEEMQLRNEVEEEQQKAKALELSLKHMKEARELALVNHEKNMAELECIATETKEKSKAEANAWLEAQIRKMKGETPASPEEEVKRKAEEEKQKKIADLRDQLKLLTGEEVQEPTVTPATSHMPRDKQQLLLQQLKAALEGRGDPQQDNLRALTVEANKTTGIGGTSTLKPDILSRLNPDTPSSMHEWLAQLNQQEEGEYLISLKNSEQEDEGRPLKQKSGMLDKPTTAIKQKQVWPQKNLGEDWADEDLDFKQLRFKHLVAGETRTIETCTEPAQILGRLRLMRRIAYLRLRGFDWYLLRKMYAAILTSIETGEYSWESNFDRFETILYRKTQGESKIRQNKQEDTTQANKKWYCREFNRGEPCNKGPTHTAWFGKGASAVKRQVVHGCATCIFRDNLVKQHPEGHPECPHKD